MKRGRAAGGAFATVLVLLALASGYRALKQLRLRLQVPGLLGAGVDRRSPRPKLLRPTGFTSRSLRGAQLATPTPTRLGASPNSVIPERTTIERMSNRLTPAFPPPRFSTEADDLRLIFEYLRISPTGPEGQRITGLGKSTISEILAGQRVRDSRRRSHVALVAELISDLRQARRSGTGSADRRATAIGWLHAGRVETSRGIRSPIELLADTELVREQLGYGR